MSMHAARHSFNGRGEVADASYTYTVKVRLNLFRLFTNVISR